MTAYDPIDSLIYLSRETCVSLDGISEEMAERFGNEDENEDVEFLNGWIDSIKKTIRQEARAHHDGRASYSTGVPFLRGYEYPATEPGDDGEEVPVIAEAWVSPHPDGSPEQPYDGGGVWMDKTHP